MTPDSTTRRARGDPVTYRCHLIVNAFNALGALASIINQKSECSTPNCFHNLENYGCLSIRISSSLAAAYSIKFDEQLVLAKRKRR